MSVGTAASDLARPPAGEQVERIRSLAADPAVVAVALLTVLGALLRFYRIGHQGFWFDEGNTALEVRFSLGQMLTLIKHYESTPPLYYSLAWVWARVFGSDEAGLRSLSAVCGVLSIPVAYGTAAKLISRRAGVIAAALTATSPLLVWYGQEARAYELVVLLVAASLLTFAYALEDPRASLIAAWVIASALALATEYYAILVVAPEALWLLYVHRRRRSVYGGIAGLALCCAPLLWFAVSQNATGHANWISRAPLGRRIAEVFPQFAAGFPSPGYSVLEPLALALAILGLVLIFTAPGTDRRKGAVLAASILVAGLAINFILILVGVDDLLTRNVISLWMPAAVAVAGGFALARARLIGVAAAAALCLIGVGASIAIANNGHYQRPDWRGVARILDAHPARGRAILIQHYRDLLPLSLYLPGLRFLPAGGARVSELDVISFSSPPSAGFCWWGSACNLWPSRMQSSYPMAGFRVVSRRRTNQFTVLALIATGAPVRITASNVSRALRRTALRQDDLLLQR